ncbi:helix-turn-helix domain-containing protein [Aestuariivirga sp.]|uniref:helix-turn-helix domain-containing protein n=1 Tax=Aestuariivirga sp. TaxID=2650926 RepID=UPI0035942E95
MREESVDVSGEFQAAEAALEHGREKPDGASDPAGEAGWYLQHERENRGESLEDVSAATGIHPYHLEAIELGDMTHMPERMEALEMIGTYAQYLGFDPEPLVEHYAHFLPAPALAPQPVHPANPAPLSSAKVLMFGRLPKLPKFSFRLTGVPGGAGGLVASLAGAVFLFAGVSYMLMPGADDAQPRPERGAVATTGMDSDADPMPTASTGGQSADISVGDEPMPDDQAQATATAGEDDLAGTNLDGISSLIQDNVPGAKEAATTLDGMVSAADVALTDEGRQFGNGNDESRLTLKARAPVWVRIEDAQGNVVMTQMLMKGDTYKVPNRPGLVVIARDGGLLSYVIDGKEKGILGTPGEILVGRSLDLKSFEG